jgi:hypothetical protein
MAGRIVYLFSCVNNYSHATVRGMDDDDAESLAALIGCSFKVALALIVLVVIIHFAAKYW